MSDDLKEDIENLIAEAGPEAMDGLYSILEDSEDITCFMLRRILRRRKRENAGENLFMR